MFTLVNPSDQTVYIYRVEATNTPDTQDWEEAQSPLVIRLSSEAIQVEHGGERFSQNMTYTLWQATPHKNGKKNKNNRVHKPKLKPLQPSAQPTQTDQVPTEARSQAKEQEAPAENCPDKEETPSIRKYIPLFREGAQRILVKDEQMQKELEGQTVETPPTTDDPVNKKATPSGQKRNSHRRSSWQSAAYRPPIMTGEGNIKPAAKGLTESNRA